MTKVAIYDSGVGGLSIYQALREACPQFEYLFVSDNQAYPYGTKAEDELLERVLNVSERIIQQASPDILVLACNTASTVCLPSLRARYKIAVVGVVPAIKPAAQISRSKVIGLLATPATINRPYTESLIDQFAPMCTVTRVGSTDLVDLAEAKLQGLPVELSKLQDILEPFLSTPNLDTLALACTHFPLLKDEISAVFESAAKPLVLIDSGLAIAKRVESLVADLVDDSVDDSVGGLVDDSVNDAINDSADRFAEAQAKTASKSQATDSLAGENIAMFTSQVRSAKFIQNLKALGFCQIQLLNA